MDQQGQDNEGHTYIPANPSHSRLSNVDISQEVTPRQEGHSTRQSTSMDKPQIQRAPIIGWQSRENTAVSAPSPRVGGDSPTFSRKTSSMEGYGNPAFQRESSSVDSRIPRYRSSFISYTDILKNLEESDPFSGDPPPPKERPMREKSSVSQSGEHGDRANARKKQLQRQPAESVNIPSSKTDPANTQEDNSRSQQESQSRLPTVKRRHSKRDRVTKGPEKKLPPIKSKEDEEETKSNHTYVLGESDSQTKLIGTDGSPQKTGNMEMSEMASRQTPKKIHLDHRDQKFRSYIGEDMDHRDAIASYIRDNIKHRQCSKYALSSKKGQDRCHCGRDDDWHVEEGINVNKNIKHHKWKPETHSRTVHADTFGLLQFYGFGQDGSESAVKAAPFVRVDHKTDLEKVWTLLSEYWHLQAPKLLISVTGGAKKFYLKDRLKMIFKRGLVNAATSTGAWIITGGTNTGVMRFVGEAIREHMMTIGSSDQKIVALGIATWGIVDNKESLIGEPGEGLFPATYNIEDLNPEGKGVSPLDVNHTHFILVDDGTEKKFGGEIEFRASLEQYIAEKMETGVAVNHSVNVPVVLLVLEGGENTLQTAKQSIDRKIPVVVIQGSGRAADFIAYAYKRTKKKDDEDAYILPPNFDTELEERARCLFDFSTEPDVSVVNSRIKVCITHVKECIKTRKMITVFHLEDADSSKEIDQAILYALLKANKSDAHSQLALALAWNRCDIARQEIFTVENRSRWQGMNLYDAMFTALVQDRVDFVKLFLDNGVELKRFLTVRRLRDLYDDVVNDRYAGSSADLLRHLLQQVQQTWKSYLMCCHRDEWKDDLPNLLSMVGRVYTYLLGDQSANPYGGKHARNFVVPDDHEVLGTELAVHSSPQDQNVTLITETGAGAKYSAGKNCKPELKSRLTRRKTKHNYDFLSPEKELFLWAILLNRRELSMLFWKLGKDQIGSALVGSALLKSLAGEADKEEEIDLSLDLYSHSQEYEQLAVGVLSECYQRDKPMAHKLLVRSLDSWGDTTCLTIADAAEQMDFMGHSCPQTKLNRIWKGKMALYTSTWKIMLALFLPFVISFIKFSTNEYTEVAGIEGKEEEEEDKVKTPTNQVSPATVQEVQFHRSKTRRIRKRLTRKLYHVTCTGFSGNTINFIRALGYYYTSPVTKFMYHLLSQLIFLSLFSYFVLTDLRPISHPNSPSFVEMFTWGWAATLLIEEIRQVLTRDPKSLKYKLSGYFSSMWNRFDQMVYVMFTTSIILRYTLSDETFIWARMFYSMTVAMYFLRFMHVFFVAKNIGPKVIMIRRMLTDLLFFICILAVFILSYGVASHALRFPNSVPRWQLLIDIVYLPYWQMYGELFLDQLEGDVPSCTSNTTQILLNPNLLRCPEKGWLVITLFVVYMVMTNILLLNLLIAMFSYTFEKVQENSEKVWRFYRYTLIYEYFDRPALAPPLIILTHIYRVILYVVLKCRKTELPSNDFRIHLEKEEYNKLTSFERAGMENYLLRSQNLDREQINVKVTNTGQRIEKVIEDLEEIKDQIRPDEASLSPVPTTSQSARGQTTSAVPLSLEPSAGVRQESYKEDLSIIHSRLSGLEEQLADHTLQMKKLMVVLQELNKSKT